MKTPKRILSLVLALIMMLGVMSPVIIPASAGETYTITVTASPSEGGTVSGAGTYESGYTALIYAQPNPGWHFVRWNSASGTIDEQSFAFVVRGNASYTAVFEKDVVISIIPDKTEALPGDTINYTLKIGPVSNLAKIRFVLSIPEGLKFVDLSSNEIDALIISLMQKLNIDAYTHISFVNSSKMLDAYGGNYSSDSDTEIMTFSCTVKSGASGEKAVGLTSCKLTDTGGNEILINTSDLQSAIEVITIPATSISLDEISLGLKEGDRKTLTATIMPENSTDTVTWFSDNPGVATVDSYGVVYAAGVGTATITARAGGSGGPSATCTVNVSEYVCPHENKTETPAMAATCTEPGNTRYYHCEDCGKYLKADGTTVTTPESELIPALGHNYENVAYSSNEDRHWKVCSRCNEDSAQVDHSWDNTSYTWSADYSTCTATHSCVYCGKEVSETVNSTSQVTAATCTESETTNYTANFTKPGFTATYKYAETGSALGHDWGAPTCTWSADNSTCTATRVCTRDASHKESETVEASAATTATCVEAGTTTYTATFVNEAFNESEERIKEVAVDALGHDLVHHDGKASTCKEKGYAEYDTCSRCDYTTYEELPLGDHAPAAAVKENVVKATCEKAGKYDSVVYCSVCEKELSRETVTVKATGHKDKNNDGKCDTCKKIIDEAKYNAYLFGKVKFNVKSGEVYKNSKVTVVAKASNVPDGYFLALFDGGKEIARGDKATVTCELSELVTQDKTLTVKVVDSAGKVQKDGDGKELSAKIEIKVKTGFFDVLVAFFKKLFGANKVTIKP